MKSLHLALTALGGLFLSLNAAQAQFRTPTVNGTTSAGEYDNEYRSTNPGDPNLLWRMTWNDTNLYVAVEDANLAEGAVIYLDTDPETVVNSANSGTTQGFDAYDGTSGTLPFAADVVLYVRNNDREYRVFNRETSQWGPAVTGFGAYADNATGQVREVSIPWASISTSGSRPANFNWLGYVAYPSGGGGAFGQVPVANPDGAIGRKANFVRYFTVLNTASGSDGSAFGPNGLDSYTHSGPSDSDFGAISVYDFTLNTPGATITRTTSGTPTWDIRNNLTIANGTVSAGLTTASISVGSDFVVGVDGGFNHSTASAELKVSGDFVVEGGFTANNGVVELAGASGEVSIANAFPNLLISGRKTLARNLFANGTLQVINGGRLSTNGNIVYLNASARLTEGTDGYIAGIVETTENVNGSGVNDFKGLGLSLNPAPNTILPGVTKVRRFTGTFVTGEANSRSLTRQYLIESTVKTGLNTSLTFGYRDAPSDVNELNGNNEQSLTFFRSLDNKAPFQPLGSSARNLVANTVTLNNLVSLEGYYTVADENAPLPIELSSFTGKAENSAVRLSWATASELQNKGFEIEHRTDQSEWKILGFVAGNGTSNQRHSYSYLDRLAVANASNYYRLRQLDLDGKSVYTNPLNVVLGTAVPVAFTLSPVPATDVLTVNGLTAGKHVAEIYNARGQRVLSQEFKDAAATTVAVSALPAGVYLVRVVGADRKTQTARFIKQ